MLLLSVVVGLELDETAAREPSVLIFTLLFAGIAVLEIIWLIVSLVVPALRRDHRVAIACFLISAVVPILAVAANVVWSWLVAG